MFLLFYSSKPATTLQNLKNNDHVIDVSFLLKKSLSKTLVNFYPLAWKVKDDMQIDCNDDGVHYVETQNTL